MQFTASAKGVLLAGKMINGVAIGGLLAVGTTYASEVSDLNYPALACSNNHRFLLHASETSLWVASLSSWWLQKQLLWVSYDLSSPNSSLLHFELSSPCNGSLPYSQSLPSYLFLSRFKTLLFLHSANCNRSPSYLVVRGKLDAARQSLARLYGQDNSIDARLAHLQSGIRHEMELSKGTSYLDCFKRTDLERTLTAILITMGTGLVGSAFLAQNIYFLILTGLNAIHAFDINIGGFALALLLMPFTWYYGDRFGRRSIYLVGTAVNIVVLAIVGGLGYASPLNKSATWAVAIIL